jgi:hypothetical protein
MNRRLFIRTFAIMPALVPVTMRSQSPTDPINAAEDFAAATWLAPAAADLRLVLVRVSRWPDSNAAARFGAYALTQAGSDLAEGEFYQSEPVDLVVPRDRLEPPAIARGWLTTVGAAAFTTDCVLLVVQRDDLVWDIRVGGAIEAGVLGIAVDLAADLVDRDRSLPLVNLVPEPVDGPGGIGFDTLVTPDGMVSNEGTPQATPAATGSQ